MGIHYTYTNIPTSRTKYNFKRRDFRATTLAGHYMYLGSPDFLVFNGKPF